MLVFPFVIRANGRVAEVADGGDEAAAQQVAMLLLTDRGERPLVPEFGSPDPTYQPGVDTADLAAAITAFGPAVHVADVTQSDPDAAGTSVIEISFTS